MANDLTWLTQDLAHGVPFDLRLFRLTRFSQRAVDGWNHEQISDAGRLLYGILQRWKHEHGEPSRWGLNVSGYVSNNPVREDAEPWDCAGPEVSDPVDLYLHRILKDKYQPYFDAVSDWGPHHEERVLAVMCLIYCRDDDPDFRSTNSSMGHLVAFKAGFYLALRHLPRVKEPEIFRLVAALSTEWIDRKAPEIKKYEEFVCKQKEKASLGGQARWGGPERSSVNAIIKDLARKRSWGGEFERPSDLWPKFYAKLDEAQLSPRELDDVYYFDGGEMTFDAFRKSLTRIRKKA